MILLNIQYKKYIVLILNIKNYNYRNFKQNIK